MPDNKEKLARTTIRLPKLLLKDLKQHCLDHDLTEQEAINNAITVYLGMKTKGSSK